MRTAFAGKMASGKSYAAQFLQRQYGGTILSFAGHFKKMAYDLWGVTSKTEIYHLADGIDRSGREIYQLLGNMMRDIDPDVWSKLLEKEIKILGSINIFIDDLRFLTEEKMLKKHGFTIIKIDSNEETRISRLKERDGKEPTKEELTNCSETIELKCIDHILYNNKTEFDLVYELERIVL
jgi:dephospho-CoA kinase